jgi:hypothetical protein
MNGCAEAEFCFIAGPGSHKNNKDRPHNKVYKTATAEPAMLGVFYVTYLGELHKSAEGGSQHADDLEQPCAYGKTTQRDPDYKAHMKLSMKAGECTAI